MKTSTAHHCEMPNAKITDFCQRHHIRRLSLYGSVLRDDFQSDSDIDILVEFQPGHTPGLAFFVLQRELSEMLVSRQTERFGLSKLQVATTERVMENATLIKCFDKALGQNVDLNTVADLSPCFRQEVLAEAAVLYDAT